MTESRSTRRSYERGAERYAAEIGQELQHKPFDRALLDAFAELTAEDGRATARPAAPMTKPG